MSALLHSADLLCAAAAGALLASIWQGLLLAIAVMLCLRAIPGLTAAVRSAVWTAVFLLIVLLPALPRPMAQPSLPAVASPAASQLPALHLDLRWSVALVCLWLLLSLLRLLRLIGGAVALRRIAIRATVIEDAGGFAGLLSSGARHARLCTTPDLDRPSVIGFFAPRILLPADLLAALEPPDLEQVLLHELEHLRRGDDWRNLLQKLALVLFPLNPVLVWIEHQLSLEREIACDERVLQLTRSRKGYAGCLARLAEHSLQHSDAGRGATLALGAWERQPELAARVYRILNGRVRTLGPVQLRLVAAALLLSASLGAAALARSPVLVSFVSAAEQPVVLPRVSPATAASQGEIIPIGGHLPLAKRSVRASTAAHILRTSLRIPARREAPPHRAPLAPTVVQTDAAAAPRVPAPAWVLTRWQSTTVPVLIEGDRPSYAAVPTPDGWIILEL